MVLCRDRSRAGRGDRGREAGKRDKSCASRVHQRPHAIVTCEADIKHARMMISTASLLDPLQDSAILAAIRWLEGVLLGSLATTIGVIAIAAIGLLMLGGYVPVRRGASAVLGCFILFGAPGIVAGLRSAIPESFPRAMAEESLPQVQQPAMPRPPSPQGYDPYAGAAVHSR